MKNLKLVNLLPIFAGLLLLLILTITLVAFQIKEKQDVEIGSALKVLQESRHPVSQVENTLEALFLAENQFREYTLNNNDAVFENYRKQITNLVSNIDTLQKVIGMIKSSPTPDKTAQIISQRDIEAQKFIHLKQLTDSLWRVVSFIESTPLKPLDPQLNLKKFVVTAKSQSIDTLQQTTISGKKKKGFLGKLKSLFKDENETQAKTSKTIIKSQTQSADTTITAEESSSDIVSRSNEFYQQQLQKILQQRNQLRQSELKLISMNYLLLNEIKTILNTIKETALEIQNKSIEQSSGSIIYSVKNLQKILISAIIALLLIALATFYLLLKNRRYQLFMLESRQKAIDDAMEKTRFLAYFSHEFRTPLSSVVGFGEQLEQTTLSPDQKEYLAGLMSSTDILLTSVNDILDLSKLQAGKMTFLSKSFIPEETLNQVVRSFFTMAGKKNLTINLECQNCQLSLFGDEIRIKQILNNLISNAIKYNGGGTINVLAKVEQNQQTAEFQITVADTGFGIAPDQVEKIFDEYSRVHDENNSRWIIGTGLGLPVTKKLVEGMSGSIVVKSELGKGSEFTVQLPLSVSENQARSVNPDKVSTLSLPPGLKLLIAEDNTLNAMLLQSIFKRLNVDIDVVENGEKAFDMLLKNNYNLLLTDYYMPIVDGIELTKMIRSHSEKKLRQMPIVILTGSISNETVEKMKLAGASDWIFKPFQQKDLLDMIKKLTNKG